MSYAEQPRYGTTQRPQHEYQRPPHPHPQQFYAAEFDYAPGQSGSYGTSAPVPQQYHRAPELSGGVANYDRNRWQDTNMNNYNSEVQYETRDRNGGGRQQPRRGPADPHQYNDMRAGRQPQLPSGHAERNGVHRPAPHDQYEDSREPYSHQGRHQRERNFDNGPVEQGNRPYNNNDPAWVPQDGWATDQKAELSTNGQPSSRDPANGTGQRSMGYPDRRTENASENNYTAVPQSKHQEPPRSAHGKPPSSSSRSETSQRPKTCK